MPFHFHETLEENYHKANVGSSNSCKSTWFLQVENYEIVDLQRSFSIYTTKTPRFPIYLCKSNVNIINLTLSMFVRPSNTTCMIWKDEVITNVIVLHFTKPSVFLNVTEKIDYKFNIFGLLHGVFMERLSKIYMSFMETDWARFSEEVNHIFYIIINNNIKMS